MMRLVGRGLVVVGVLGCLLSLPISALGQAGTAGITGRVTDSSGSVMEHAHIRIINTRTGIIAYTRTDGQGNYTVAYLQPGIYQVNVRMAGFQQAVVQQIKLAVDFTATINITLQPGTVHQQVTVRASTSQTQLQLQSASLGTEVGSHQLLQLPLLGRDPYSLVALAPGVLPTPGPPGPGSIVNGGRESTSEILLDGGETRDSTTNGVAYTPPLESVQQFRIITNNYSAQYGRSGGGVLSVITRSGTNHWHGSAYEFLRNNILNANSWNNIRVGLPRDSFHRNEFGGALGGPVVIPHIYNGRNRTFFFINVEGVLQRTPDNIINTVPTAQERAGNFSQLFTNNGQLIKIYDPATTQPIAGKSGQYSRTQFPGNIIPTNRLNSVALNVLKYLPLPNRPGLFQNYAQSETRLDDISRLFFRLDQTIGENQRLSWTFGRQNETQATPAVNLAYPGDGTNGDPGVIGGNPRISDLSDTITFAPNLVGVFHGSLTRTVLATSPLSAGYNFAQLGFSSSLAQAAKVLLFPRFDIGDITGFGPQRASYLHDAQQNVEFQNQYSWFHGNHSINFGMDYIFFSFNDFRPNFPSGDYQFGRTYTQGPNPLTASTLAGDGFATFLLGLPTGGSFSYDPSIAASQKYIATYLQDDWKMTPNFTWDWGLRWEYQSPWTDRFNQLAFFNPNAIDPITGRPGVLQFVGNSPVSRNQTNPDQDNFSPRLGFAWHVLPKTALRAGYGWFYFPGSGGIGGGAPSLGNGFETSTNVFLGAPPAAPNTPPSGASLAQPFVTGLLTPPNTGVGSSIYTTTRNIVTPFSQAWNISLERVLGRGLLVNLAYTGSRGEHLWVDLPYGAASPADLALGAGLNKLVANPFYKKITAGPLSAPQIRASQLLLPFPQYLGITNFRDTVGDSIYHAMTLQLTKSMGHGLYLQASYTISKEIDDVGERFVGRSNLNIHDPYNLRLARSIGEWDRPQFLVINYVYQFPFGPRHRWLRRGWVSDILGDWQLAGITTFGKGIPVVISAPNTTQLSGLSSGAMRSNTISSAFPSGLQSPQHWFNTAAFTAAPPFSMGNDSRTEPNLRGPGLSNFDIGLSRIQPIGEGKALQFRAEFFNALNTPPFGPPIGAVNSPQFGQILTAGSPREVQLGLRLTF